MQEAQEKHSKSVNLLHKFLPLTKLVLVSKLSFQLGSGGIPRGIFGGLAGFKRRGKVKVTTSDALSIAANT